MYTSARSVYFCLLIFTLTFRPVSLTFVRARSISSRRFQLIISKEEKVEMGLGSVKKINLFKREIEMISTIQGNKGKGYARCS